MLNLQSWLHNNRPSSTVSAADSCRDRIWSAGWGSETGVYDVQGELCCVPEHQEAKLEAGGYLELSPNLPRRKSAEEADGALGFRQG